VLELELRGQLHSLLQPMDLLRSALHRYQATTTTQLQSQMKVKKILVNVFVTFMFLYSSVHHVLYKKSISVVMKN
jgi:hypothetical protein